MPSKNNLTLVKDKENFGNIVFQKLFTLLSEIMFVFRVKYVKIFLYAWLFILSNRRALCCLHSSHLREVCIKYYESRLKPKSICRWMIGKTVKMFHVRFMISGNTMTVLSCYIFRYMLW